MPLKITIYLPERATSDSASFGLLEQFLMSPLSFGLTKAEVNMAISYYESLEADMPRAPMADDDEPTESEKGA